MGDGVAGTSHNSVFMPLWGLVLIINSFLKLTLSRWTLWTGRVCHAAQAFSQLQTYKQAIPSLFTYNALLIVSDGWDALCGTVTSDWGRFMSLLADNSQHVDKISFSLTVTVDLRKSKSTSIKKMKLASLTLDN